MKSSYTSLAAMAAAVALDGCAVTSARMAVPPPLADEPAVVFEGIGAGQRGRFRAGPYSADFIRSDTRLALFDRLDERRSGKLSFALEGLGIDGAINADCRVSERTITLSIISFDARPMAYTCRFSQQGLVLPARFEVQEERKGVPGMLMRRSRRGEIAIDRVVLQIVSVHKLEGSGIETANPIGYLLAHDGVPVGAVELNGRPAVRFASGSDAVTRRTVMIAATALGVLWDPADSPLGQEAD